MIKFVLLQPHYCEICKKTILHEYGNCLKTGTGYRQCISCEKLTEVKNESQRQQDHVTPHYTPQQD